MSQVRTIKDFKTSKIMKGDFSLHQSNHASKIQKNYKNRGKKTSWVWKWYQELNDDNCEAEEEHVPLKRRKDLAVCLVCQEVVIRLPRDKKSPKKLMTHLKIHGINSGEDRLVCSDVDLSSINHGCEAISLHLPKKQQMIRHENIVLSSNWYSDQTLDNSINEKTEKYESNLNEKKYAFFQLILDFLLENNLSISCMESSSFQDLLRFLNPDYSEHLKTLETLFSSFLEITGPNSDE